MTPPTQEMDPKSVQGDYLILSHKEKSVLSSKVLCISPQIKSGKVPEGVDVTVLPDGIVPSPQLLLSVYWRLSDLTYGIITTRK